MIATRCPGRRCDGAAAGGASAARRCCARSAGFSTPGIRVDNQIRVPARRVVLAAGVPSAASSGAAKLRTDQRDEVLGTGGSSETDGLIEPGLGDCGSSRDYRTGLAPSGIGGRISQPIGAGGGKENKQHRPQAPARFRPLHRGFRYGRSGCRFRHKTGQRCPAHLILHVSTFQRPSEIRHSQESRGPKWDCH